MKTPQPNRSCPECNQSLPPDAPEGICPECLMLGGLETMPMEDRPTTNPEGHLPENGDIFGGYRIGNELGRGGMGAVYEAEQIETGRRVALKLLNHQLDSPEARARFLREGRLAASINHPNSVYVFGTEEIEDMPAIAMELVNGGTLEERVKADGPLPVSEAVDTILQLIAGLEAAAEIGILHRDIKPGNCFQDIDGTVKIGDFGLSISSEARDEEHLTLEGTIFGTPAFASPEQLRGEELNVRSDIYAVGATLYYLLTGRAPFQGKTVAQLFANVLEKQPPSLTELRREVPVGLARQVMGCLEKTAGDRLPNYKELRNSLAPFSSEVPAPAALPVRFLAFMIDGILFSGISLIAQFFVFEEFLTPDTPAYWPTVAVSLLIWVSYFSITESRWGASLGKAICRLRVIEKNQNTAGLWKAMLRTLIVLIVPPLPIWIYSAFSGGAFVPGNEPGYASFFALGSFYVLAGLLFITARRRNGFASVADFATKTRVVRRKARIQERPQLENNAMEPVVNTVEAKKIGPYHILDVVEKSADQEWLIAYDARLLRKVWLRVVPEGTPAVKSTIRQLARVGRLRWIAGRRTEFENWDAFENPGGQLFTEVVASSQPDWEQLRHWMLDLSQEFEIAEKEGSLPEILSMDRIWITSNGRAKLFDFPAPGTSGSEATSSERPVELLNEMAKTTGPPKPFHATKLCHGLSSERDLSALVEELKSSTNRRVSVSRGQRELMVLGSIAFPVLVTLIMMLGMKMMNKMFEDSPQILPMNQVLTLREQGRMFKSMPVPEDRIFSIFISSHYREMVEDPKQWNSYMAVALVGGHKRAFVEKSLVDFPNPTAAEIAEAEKELGPIAEVNSHDFFNKPWMPLLMFGITLLVYVSFPAVLASLICFNGLVMLCCGVVIVKKDGTRASRLRCLWRSVVTWFPLAVALFIAPFLALIIGWIATGSVAGAILIIPTLISVYGNPKRSLQDRIARTYLVPR